MNKQHTAVHNAIDEYLRDDEDGEIAAAAVIQALRGIAHDGLAGADLFSWADYIDAILGEKVDEMS